MKEKRGLRLPQKTKLPDGKSGYEILTKLFKKANKVYINGTRCAGLCDWLDVSKIVSSVNGALQPLFDILK